MDPLGGTSISGNTLEIIKLTRKVSSRLSAYCKADPEIPPIFRELSLQVPAIATICQDLQNSPSIPSDEVILVLDDCFQTFDSLNKTLSAVIPEIGDSVGSRFKKGIRSLHNDGKVDKFKSQLESHKSFLTLYLTSRKQVSTTHALHGPLTYHNLPQLGQAKFVGRKLVLGSIDRALKEGGQDPRVVVLLGMGGQGKTSLAIEYCQREKSKAHFRTILWINSISNTSIQQSFAEIARNIAVLSGETRVFDSAEAPITFIHGIIRNRSEPWLFVFDNYDWPQRVKDILSYTPKVARGAVIMTSRHAEVGQLGTRIDVVGMSENDAVELLINRTEHPRTISNLEQAKIVVSMLEKLPLAIDQSAAYIRSRKITFEQFLDHYQNRKEKLMKFVPTVWDYQRSSGANEEKTSLNVFTTWELSFSQAEELSPIGPSLSDFLTMIGFFFPLQIRMEMFQAYFEAIQASDDAMPAWLETFSSGSTWDKYEYQDVIVFVSELSLVKHIGTNSDDDNLQDTPGLCTIALHPLVRDWMQLRIPIYERRKWTLEALVVLDHYIRSAGNDYRIWPLKVRLQALSHVDASLELQSKYAKNWDDTDYTRLRSAFGIICAFYADNGRYKEAEIICQDILRADLKAHSSATQVEATELQLANIYLLRGNYQHAQELLVKLRDAFTESSDAKYKIHVQKNLAKALSLRGKYEEAAPLFRDILEQQALISSANDLQVLHTKEQLAYVYRNLGKHREAIELYKVVLEAYRDADLENHVEALHSMVNLANTYRAQAAYDLATPLYENASKELAAKLHADHPAALSTKNFMAINLREMERYEEAEHAFRDVVERSGRVLGQEHPDTLKATNNFAIICDRMGHLDEAEELYRTALVGRMKVLKADNPYTLRTLERLVNLLWSQGRYDEALEITKLALRQGNPVDETLQDLSLSDSAAEQELLIYGPIEVLFENAVKRDNAKLAEAHRDRIETQKSLARIYASRGKHQEAEEHYKAAKHGEEILRQQLGRAKGKWLDSKETLVEIDTGVEPSPLMLETLTGTSGQTESEISTVRSRSW